jgi:hypothetical protein
VIRWNSGFGEPKQKGCKNMDEFHLPPDLFFEVRDIANLKWRRRLKRLTDVFSSFRPIKAELNLRTQRTSAHSDRCGAKE